MSHQPCHQNWGTFQLDWPEPLPILCLSSSTVLLWRRANQPIIECTAGHSSCNVPVLVDAKAVCRWGFGCGSNYSYPFPQLWLCIRSIFNWFRRHVTLVAMSGQYFMVMRSITIKEQGRQESLICCFHETGRPCYYKNVPWTTTHICTILTVHFKFNIISSYPYCT
jgi:hypothetical protein